MKAISVLLVFALAMPAFAQKENVRDNTHKPPLGAQPSFAQVLSLRFDAPDQTAFKAFEKWAQPLNAKEQKRLSYRKPDGSTALQPCGFSRLRGLPMAMAITVGGAKDRADALRIWSEVEEAYFQGLALEKKGVRAARIAARQRPTRIGAALAVRAARDQAWREARFLKDHDDIAEYAITYRLMHKGCKADVENTAWLKRVVNKGQWPLIARDGKEAAMEAWLLAQHADRDRVFQAQVLKVMEPLVARKEAKGTDYLYLFIALLWGKVVPNAMARNLISHPRAACALRRLKT